MIGFNILLTIIVIQGYQCLEVEGNAEYPEKSHQAAASNWQILHPSLKPVTGKWKASDRKQSYVLTTRPPHQLTPTCRRMAEYE